MATKLFPKFSQGLAQDPTTRRIWYGLAMAHDFESHDGMTEENLYQKIFASHFGQLSIIFLWTSGNLFHVAWQGNFEQWVTDPVHIRPIAHAIWDPHFGQPFTTRSAKSNSPQGNGSPDNNEDARLKALIEWMYKCLAFFNKNALLEATQQVRAFLPIYNKNSELFNKAFAVLTTAEKHMFFKILTLTVNVSNDEEQEIVVALLSRLLNYFKNFSDTEIANSECLLFGKSIFAFFMVQFYRNTKLNSIPIKKLKQELRSCLNYLKAQHPAFFKNILLTYDTSKKLSKDEFINLFFNEAIFLQENSPFFLLENGINTIKNYIFYLSIKKLNYIEKIKCIQEWLKKDYPFSLSSIFNAK